MGATVLQVGDVPPPLAEALTAKYDALVLPINAGREDFLAEHGASVKAIVDAGQAPIDAELMGALPNLRRDRPLHGRLTTRLTSTPRVGWGSASATQPTR